MLEFKFRMPTDMGLKELYMEITKDLVLYLEALRRIRLEQGMRLGHRRIWEIFSDISISNELDTAGVEPLSHSSGVTNVMREDIITNGDMRRGSLNAPESADGSILVPKTFD